MNSLFNCWWYVCTCEIDWLSVVVIESMCQKSYVWICCIFCEKWWIMKLWFDELGMNSWIIELMMFENMLLMNWYDEYAIGELMMKVVVDVE